MSKRAVLWKPKILIGCDIALIISIRKENNMQNKKDAAELRHKILNIVGIILCIILIPILIINCTLIVKSWINEDEVPSIGNMMPLIVLTDSMHDEFPAGSIIITQKAEPDDIAEGDIISFFDPESKTNAILTHKVEKIEYDEDGNKWFWTKGTANNTGDRLPVPAENLLGKYTGISFAGLGKVAMFMQSTTGFIVCVFVPILALIGYDFIRRRRYEQKNAVDKDELMKELEELRKMKAEAVHTPASTEEENPSEENTN